MPQKSGGPGGGGAGNIRAGGAEYELALRDNMTAQLNKVQNGVKGFAEKVKKHMAPLGGALGQIFETGARGGAIGVSVALAQKAIGAVSDSIGEWAFGTKSFKRELEASVSLAGRLSEQSAEIAASTREWAGMATNRLGRVGRLDAGVADQEAILARLRAERAKTRAAFDRNFGVTGRNIGLGIIGELGTSQDAARDALKSIDAEIAKVVKTLGDLRGESFRAFDVMSDKSFLNSIEKFKDSMREARSEDDIGAFTKQVRDLRRAFGGDASTKSLFDNLKNEAGYTETRIKINAATKALTDYVAAQELARKQADMTGDQIAIMNAEIAGVDAAAIASARRSLLSGSGMGQLLGGFLSTLPAIGEAIKGLSSSTRGGFVTPAGVAQQMFGGGSTKTLQEIRDGKGGLPQAIGRATSAELRKLFEMQ